MKEERKAKKSKVSVGCDIKAERVHVIAHAESEYD